MTAVREDEDLRRWSVYVEGDDRCTCEHAWRACIGRLYGISMGPGWVRLTTAADCPHHAARLKVRG